MAELPVVSSGRPRGFESCCQQHVRPRSCPTCAPAPGWEGSTTNYPAEPRGEGSEVGVPDALWFVDSLQSCPTLSMFCAFGEWSPTARVWSFLAPHLSWGCGWKTSSAADSSVCVGLLESPCPLFHLEFHWNLWRNGFLPSDGTVGVSGWSSRNFSSGGLINRQLCQITQEKEIRNLSRE